MDDLHPDERRVVRKISHDLNNLVTVIASLCELILMDHRDDSELCEDVREIKGNAEHAGELSERLRSMMSDAEANP